MPAFNVARYIAESIDSVLAQTYQDLELVVVNDGSTDATLSIVQEYWRRYPDRIVVVSQENRGLAGARNTAMAAARGSVFALLDSDDTWCPTFLAEQMHILDAHPDVAIVTGNAFNRGGRQDGCPARPVDDRRPVPNLTEILRDETAVFIMSVFRRTVVERIGGFDECFRTNEDYDFWIRAALAGFTFARNSRPLGYYRRHANSLSASEVRMIDGILRVFRKTLPCCEPDSIARRVVEGQIDFFETDLLRARARAALDEGDGASAADVLDALRHRRRSLTVALAAHALRYVPAAVMWMYRARRRLRSRPTHGALAPT